MGFLRLRLELRALQAAIDELREAIEQHSETISTAEERNRNKPSTPQPVQAVVSFDNQTKGDTKAESDRQYGVQNSIRWAAWLAFGAATFYAGIAAYQTCWVRQATLATQKQLSDFEAVEAAQIAIEFLPTVKIGKPSQGLIVDGNIDITNIGQTTAVDFTAMGYSWDRSLKPSTPGVPGFVSGSSNVTPFNVSGVPLGSGRTNHYPIGIQVGQVDEIRRGEWQSGIWIDYRYNDVFGRPYTGRECFMVNPGNVLEFVRCPQNTIR